MKPADSALQVEILGVVLAQLLRSQLLEAISVLRLASQKKNHSRLNSTEESRHIPGRFLFQKGFEKRTIPCPLTTGIPNKVVHKN